MKLINGIKLAITDLSNWVKVKSKLPSTGYINGYVASSGTPFGSGKTLSCVDKLSSIVDKYNGKIVSCKKVIIQIYSNIDLKLGIPYTKINSLDDFVKGLEEAKTFEEHNNVLIYSYLFIDELGCEMNSRNFSKNFTPDFLAKIVTVRHYKCAMLWTAQSYNLVDKIIRDLSTNIYTCSHLWRFYKCKRYFPLDMDLLAQDKYIKPIDKYRFFAWNELFAKYDTFSSFEKLKNDVQEGAYATQDDLYNRMVTETRVYKPKLRRKYRKR